MATIETGEEVGDLSLTDVEVVKNLNRDINCLSDGTRMVRRRTLEKLHKEILGTEEISKEHLNLILKEVCKPLLNLYRYPSDKCRELSIKLITGLCQKIDEPWIYLPYIIPVLVDRLGNQSIEEQAEEIRLLHLESLNILTEVSRNNIDLYTKDIVTILQRTIIDPFSDVIKQSCDCCQKLTNNAPDKFFYFGEPLIPSLLKSISHQHHKVRAACLKTIGAVVRSTSGKEVDNVVSHIAQRTFDHSPPVRSMVADVIGDWLLNLRDRYSYFHKLLPLLLTGLSDEMSDIREKSKTLFNQIGKQYELENEEDFKDKLDFQIVKHFQAFLGEERPSIGCRSLVQRNFSKILPALLGDLKDWVVNTRIKAAQLLYHLIFYAEDYITMHLEPLLQGLYKSVQDEEETVVTETIKCAKLIGLYVEPSISCKMVLPQLRSASVSSTAACAGTISILTAFIQGGIPNLLNNELNDICLVVCSSDVGWTVSDEVHAKVNLFAQAVLSKEDLHIETVTYSLFTMLLNVTSMAQSEYLVNNAKDLLKDLSTASGLQNSSDLIGIHGLELLEGLKTSLGSWTGNSPENLVFGNLLLMADASLPKLIDDAVVIFEQNLQVDKDAESKLKLFTLISKIAMKAGNFDEIRSALKKHSKKLIKSTIIPNCIWKAGRIAAAVRAASMSCLWSFLQAHLLDSDELQDIFTELITQVISCLDDDNQTTRNVTCKTVLRLLLENRNSLDAQQLNLIYPELLKRMDDSSDEIRIITTKIFSAFFKCLNESDYDLSLYQLHLQAIFKGLLIHLDDPTKEIQESVLVALKDACQVHPRMLLSELNQVRHKHRLSRYCEELSRYIETEIIPALATKDES